MSKKKKTDSEKALEDNPIFETLMEAFSAVRTGGILIAGKTGALRLALGRQERIGLVFVPKAPAGHPELVVGLLDGEGQERGSLTVAVDGSWKLEIPPVGERPGIVLP